MVHAGGWLIEQQQTWSRGQRARNLNPAAVAVRKIPSGGTGEVADAQFIKQRSASRLRRAFLRADTGQSREHGQ
jgi:hypothetical protein